VGLNVRGVPVSVSWDDAKLGGGPTKEAAFTFCWVNWEAPFQEPFVEVVKGLLSGVSSFQWIRGGEPGVACYGFRTNTNI